MVEIRFTAHTRATPEQVIAAAIDFSPRRPALWPNLDPKRFQLLSITDTSAEAIEGTAVLGGIWARERYDWSRPGTVRAEVAESNVFAAGSSWELHVNPDDGGATVEWVSVRHPRGPRGMLLVTMLALAGRRMLKPMLDDTLRRLEADNLHQGEGSAQVSIGTGWNQPDVSGNRGTQRRCSTLLRQIRT